MIKSKILCALQLIVFSLAFMPTALAEEKNSELVLPFDNKVFTKETIFESGGVQYRKVEFQNENFFLELNGPKSDGDSLRVYCQQPAGFQSKPLIRVGIKTMERSSFFLEALRLSCVGENPTASQQQQMMNLAPYLAIGFALDTKDDHRSIFKKKKILFMPWGIGFAADM